MPAPITYATVTQAPAGITGIAYNFYSSEPSSEGTCNFYSGTSEPCLDAYDIVANYADHRTEIDTQLRSLVAAGYVHEKLMIWHDQEETEVCAPGVPHRSGLKSAGGLAPHCVENIVELVKSIRNAGFFDVLIDFGPEWRNNWFDSPDGSWPATWQSQPALMFYYRENLAVIQQVHDAVTPLQAWDFTIRLDLENETIHVGPEVALAASVPYAAQMWADYTAKNGTANTVGFSFLPYVNWDTPGTLSAVYGTKPPPMFDVHIYASVGGLATELAATGAALAAQGYGSVPWITSETYCCETVPAGQPRWVGVWPMNRAGEYRLFQ